MRLLFAFLILAVSASSNLSVSASPIHVSKRGVVSSIGSLVDDASRVGGRAGEHVSPRGATSRFATASSRAAYASGRPIQRAGEIAASGANDVPVKVMQDVGQRQALVASKPVALGVASTATKISASVLDETLKNVNKMQNEVKKMVDTASSSANSAAKRYPAHAQSLVKESQQLLAKGENALKGGKSSDEALKIVDQAKIKFKTALDEMAKAGEASVLAMKEKQAQVFNRMLAQKSKFSAQQWKTMRDSISRVNDIADACRYYFKRGSSSGANNAGFFNSADILMEKASREMDSLAKVLN